MPDTKVRYYLNITPLKSQMNFFPGHGFRPPYPGSVSRHILSLHPAGCVPAGKGLNLFSGNQVKVPGYGMLQRGGRNAELKGVPEVLAIQHTADHAARKGIAAAHTRL